MEHQKRHKLIWKILYPLCRLYMLIHFNFHPKDKGLPYPCLVVANHTTDLDPIMLGVALHKTHLYFVASDHIFRKAFTAKLLMFLQSPIVRLKGTTADSTALTAIRRLRKGCSVAVFAEGNRSFNGRTCAIIESTAKLARASGAGLATVRFRGGYLSSPRWSGNSRRRGRMTSELVRVIPPEELKTMKPDEIAAIIRADIYEDAYETQRQSPIAYRGRRRAEHLERVLFYCPQCGGIGTLQSRGNELSCSCGMKTTYNLYGFFEGGGLPWDNVYDWDLAQTEILKTRTEEAGDSPVFSDTDVVLTVSDSEKGETTLGEGGIFLFRDRMECCGRVFPFDRIAGMNISGPQMLELTSEGTHYRISSPKIRCLRKYLTGYYAVTDPENILAV